MVTEALVNLEPETAISLVSLGFAPITVWLAAEQLKRQSIKDTSYSLRVNLHKSEADYARERYLSIKHNGIAPLYNFSVYRREDMGHKILKEKAVFSPGDELESVFRVSGDLELLFRWRVPARSGNGQKEEALRMQYTSEGTFRERWKEYWWTSLRLSARKRSPKFVTKRLKKRRTRFPLGKWEPQREKISREGDRPGWP